MKKVLLTVLLFFTASLTMQAIDVAVVCLDNTSPNDRESAAKGMYEDYGWSVTLVDDSNADYQTLNNYDLSVAAENDAIAESVIGDLIDNGYKVLLLYSSGRVMGGTWGDHYYSDELNLLIEENDIFLDGYKSNYSINMQDDYRAQYISSNYPAGWTIIGRNTNSSSQKTVLYKTGSTGGKGVIFTYDPQGITDVGQNYYDMMHEWLTGTAPYTGKTVLSGDVAFIISRYDDDANPDLTDRENAVKGKLENYGYDITYIRAGRLQESNISNATMVVAADYPSIDKYTIEDAIDDGQNVFIINSAGAVLGGTWGNHYYDDELNLYIEENEEFLDGLKSDYSINLQDGYRANYVSSGYPSGWNIIGRNTNNTSQKTVLYKTDNSGGKGLIFTYDFQGFTDLGKNIFDRIYKWFEGSSYHSGKTVPNGDVAFIIEGYDDDDNPTLTDRENAVKGKLENYGYDITYIRSGRLPESDISDAGLIVAAEYSSIDKYTIEDAIEDGQNVLLLNDAGIVLGGNWGNHYYSEELELFIEENDQFLDGYKADYSINMQDGYHANYISSGYPSGWTIIGRNINSSSQKTVLYDTHLSGGKGLIFTYDIQGLTDEGKNFFDRIYKWFEGSAYYSGKTVPSGDIAFIIEGYDDDDNPTLTTRESAAKALYEAKGYDITYIRSGRLPESDLSGASIIVAVEYPSIDKITIEDLLSDGKNVNLFWESSSVLGSDFGGHHYGNYKYMVVESTSEYLSNYQVGDEEIVQSDGYARYIHNSYPSGWTALARNKQHTSHKTLFSYNNIGKGLICTYNPEYLSTAGNALFDDMEVWSESENDDLGKPVLTTPVDNSTQVNTSPDLKWNSVDDATKYNIQVASDALFNNIVKNVTEYDTDYNPSLSTNTKYYWKVRAKNNTETGIWSEVSSFTTGSTSGGGSAGKEIEVSLYMHGLWNGTSHETAPLTCEIRSGSDLPNSTLVKRVPGSVDASGEALFDFGDAADGTYWIVVRAAGFLPLGSTSKVTLSSSKATYDFTTGTSKAAGGDRALYYNGTDYLMRGGDYNGDRRSSATDIAPLSTSYGKNLRTYVPEP